MLSELFV